MKFNQIVLEGLFEPILKDNEIKLTKPQLELIDIIACGTDKEFKTWVANNQNKTIEGHLLCIVGSIVEQLAENSTQYHMFCNQYLSESETGTNYKFNND